MFYDIIDVDLVASPTDWPLSSTDSDLRALQTADCESRAVGASLAASPEHSSQQRGVASLLIVMISDTLNI